MYVSFYFFVWAGEKRRRLSRPKPLTAAELQVHPEFPHITWDLKPQAKGKLSVAKGRGGPLDIAWEVHGEGENKMVWIMGLGGLKTSWQRQTKDFSHTQGSKYSSLVVDNRGMGESSKPLQRYSTSEMAKDLLEVIDHVGWTKERQLNLVGISMGGMIAQELAYMIPNRIATLNLISTAPRLVNTVGFVENLRNRINLFIPRSIDDQLAHVKHNIYTDAFLEAPDGLEYKVQPFPTNGDRFAAQEVAKRQMPQYFNRTGFMAQAIAAGWHHKTDAQLKEIGDNVGRERILVLHGTKDRMITFPHAEMMLKALGGEESGVRKAFFEEQGHVVPIELRQEFNNLIEEMVEKGNALNAKA
ncbi:alpha/beta-hydrolase [Aureobasidium subglaciale]|nr:alpha/beta-hydrolase [Aureobasidium subglaciale]KAI5225511.1 alpha/beta-hydrolase [Aureobasidium subglaciale]